MKVTGYDLRKSQQGKMHAFGKIILDDVLEIEVKIMEGKNGLFMALPSKQGTTGKWYNIVRFIDKEIFEKVNDQVVFWYEKNLKNAGAATE